MPRAKSDFMFLSAMKLQPAHRRPTTLRFFQCSQRGGIVCLRVDSGRGPFVTRGEKKFFGTRMRGLSRCVDRTAPCNPIQKCYPAMSLNSPTIRPSTRVAQSEPEGFGWSWSRIPDNRRSRIFRPTPTPDVQWDHFYVTLLNWEFLLKWYNFF